MRITSTSADRLKDSVSSDTVEVVCVSTAPAMPASTAAIVYALRRCARLGAPMAGMRVAFSRMPRSARPKGEWITRRATRKQTNSTASAYA